MTTSELRLVHYGPHLTGFYICQIPLPNEVKFRDSKDRKRLLGIFSNTYQNELSIQRRDSVSLISEPRDVKIIRPSRHSCGTWLEILESRYRKSDKKTNEARQALSK